MFSITMTGCASPDPSLRGKAVVVGGSKGGRGVVTSSSYEARAFGVRSGMSIRDATTLAPHAVFVPGNHDAYAKYSSGTREIVERFSPIVIAASIDEQYVDFHGCESLYRQPSDEGDDQTILRTVRAITRTSDAGRARARARRALAAHLRGVHGGSALRRARAGEQ